MDPTLLALRWAHIIGAVVAVGGLVFARFALLPTVSELDEPTRERVHEGIRRRWLPFVIGAITLLLASGLANFLLFNGLVKSQQWAEGQWMRTNGYHALFGIKFLLALGVFYLASALVGRGGSTRWVRNDRATWLSVTLGLALAVVMISGWMRNLHTGPNLVDDERGVSMGSSVSPAEEGRPETPAPPVERDAGSNDTGNDAPAVPAAAS
jgi:uncharacterized membrane protein